MCVNNINFHRQLYNIVNGIIFSSRFHTEHQIDQNINMSIDRPKRNLSCDYFHDTYTWHISIYDIHRFIDN